MIERCSTVFAKDALQDRRDRISYMKGKEAEQEAEYRHISSTYGVRLDASI